jgi:hypothetical protein
VDSSPESSSPECSSSESSWSECSSPELCKENAGTVGLGCVSTAVCLCQLGHVLVHVLRKDPSLVAVRERHVVLVRVAWF